MICVHFLFICSIPTLYTCIYTMPGVYLTSTTGGKSQTINGHIDPQTVQCICTHTRTNGTVTVILQPKKTGRVSLVRGIYEIYFF